MTDTTRVISAQADDKGSPFFTEALSGTAKAIKPGHLVEELADKTVQKHAISGGFAQVLVADLNLPIGGTVEDVYADNTVVRYGAYQKGQEVFLRVANGTAAIALGARLQSAGSTMTGREGTVETFAPQEVMEGGAATFDIETNNVIGFAREAVDNSGGSVDEFVLTRIA